MKTHKTSDELVVTIPLESIEEGAMEQIHEVLAMPMLKKLVVLPGVHKGYSLPIETVALLDSHIWPAAVGYDIGCGMGHINTGMKLSEFKCGDLSSESVREKVFDRIHNMVPVGSSEQTTVVKDVEKFPNASKFGCLADAVRYKASKQIGTLGGGNHFIEIGVDKDEVVGITVHSGSRRPGWIIAEFYMKMFDGPIPVHSLIACNYIVDMHWAIHFALQNRVRMLMACLHAMGMDAHATYGVVNEAHNYAETVRDGILHRKGATSAKFGEIGIIPANMQDGVYITEGLGSEDHLWSASHGSGRTMSRSDARKKLDYEEFYRSMSDITADIRPDILDESPKAYKDIGGVLAAQEGLLIKVTNHFKPIINIKG